MCAWHLRRPVRNMHRFLATQHKMDIKGRLLICSSSFYKALSITPSHFTFSTRSQVVALQQSTQKAAFRFSSSGKNLLAQFIACGLNEGLTRVIFTPHLMIFRLTSCSPVIGSVSSHTREAMKPTQRPGWSKTQLQIRQIPSNSAQPTHIHVGAWNRIISSARGATLNDKVAAAAVAER